MTDLTIHTYTAAEAGLLVNSYLLETTEGLVLIDATLLVSDARALAARVAALRTPLVAAFVTHAHPDHFNGLPYVVDDDVPVYALTSVADMIAEVAVPKREQWQPVYGQEWPDHHRVPDHPLTTGTSVSVAGLRIEVHEVGSAESHADSYLLVHSDRPPVAFIGDLAFNGVHSYTADGHTTGWLQTLDRLSGELAQVLLYPGHGQPGGLALLDDQRRYLLMYREAVRQIAAGAGTLSDVQKRELTEVMTRFLPDAPLEWMIALGADSVAAELASESAARVG